MQKLFFLCGIWEAQESLLKCIRLYAMMHWLYFLYSSAVFGYVMLKHKLNL